MSLGTALLTKPRETSGGSSSNRFDYQKDWTLCHLLELHATTRDYVIVMEHHEDVSVYFFTEAPEKVDCFQIKTKRDGKWSLANLLSRKGGKGGKKLFSILGKLFGNYLLFGASISSLNFVSNARFVFNLANGINCDNKNFICLDKLKQADIKKITQQMANEHSLSTEPTLGSLVTVHVTDLSLDDHSRHATGRLSDFLDRHFPGHSFPVSAVYRAIFSEIQRKHNYEWDISSLDALLKNKAITRDQFQEMLNKLSMKARFSTLWTSIQSQLSTEGEPYSNILAIKSACTTLEVDRMDRTNQVLQKIQTAAGKFAQTFHTPVAQSTLRQMLEDGLKALALKKIKGASCYDINYLKAILLFAIHGY